MGLKKKLFINGEWIESEQYADLISPYSEEKIAEIPQASEKEVDAAIDAAYNNRAVMAKLTAYEKADILEKLVGLLNENRLKAAQIISLESSKPLKFSLGEVDRTIETYKFAAEEAKRIHGEMIPLDAARNGANRLGYTLREPIGVVAAITPFNFPMNLVAHKVGPAIAAGNTIVLKPASQTPLSAYFLAELLEEAGLPKGALNVVSGSGSLVGERLVTSDKVNMVTFTGSPEVGIGIRMKAGLKKVALELGSNAGLIIDDGVNLDKIIPKCVIGAFSNQGQICISLQRIYIHENSFEAFTEKFKLATEQLVLGDPLDENTDLSSLISRKEQERAKAWIDEAVSDGGQIISGGRIENNILLPTALVDVGSDSKISCQEVFAPIVTINPIKNVDEAIDYINDSRFGLQAGIFTKDIHTAMHASKRLEVGGVMINDIPTYRVDQMPYGGVKESGNAREGLKYTIEEMTEMKLVVWNQEEF
ncbi:MULTISPECIES: aldehyde dehydrogenase family protein [unclassified Peribacillus]|uniref:aldehyde dehydrogenase family protein n=1 Tax=unclassified Peribacillus TaxID=2675266 RepID=UPI001F4DADD8|nr:MULTISPECIES: aldehyde dehydrogenase family protein [unclassified Peribacillus]MCK1986032.1 aldehyde dehydrogenase family protein [Peribacillus sp. Aquil_B1]MCK2011255.1 aldehyde dehydrogenase family protein [Peribacillus sp. Aquil_B8]